MFSPAHCPYAACEAHQITNAYKARKCGSYIRKCDKRTVQRFQCSTCRRYFSTQTFRGNYRLRRPEIDAWVFLQLISKVTLRQIARTQGCRRRTVERRLDRYGSHARDFHVERLRDLAASGGISADFVMDELETYEGDRKLKPITVPVLVEDSSFFVVDLQAAPIPARRPLSRRSSKRLERLEALEGKRRSGSREAVGRVFSRLGQVLSEDHVPLITTDLKTTYPGRIKAGLPRGFTHRRVSSRRKRGTSNPLFPVNFSFAMMRDGISRLVRRSWAGSKAIARLETHLWVWVAWRNYIRAWKGKSRETRSVSAAQRVGAEQRKYSTRAFLRWRVFPEARPDWRASPVQAT